MDSPSSPMTQGVELGLLAPSPVPFDASGDFLEHEDVWTPLSGPDSATWRAYKYGRGRSLSVGATEGTGISRSLAFVF